MPKYWGGNYFAHGSFSKVGQKQKTEGDSNGQATHGARKHAWRTQAAWAKISIINLSTTIYHLNLVLTKYIDLINLFLISAMNNGYRG